MEAQLRLAVETNRAIETLTLTVAKLKEQAKVSENTDEFLIDKLQQLATTIESFAKNVEESLKTNSETLQQVAALGKQTSLQATESLQIVYALTGRSNLVESQCAAVVTPKQAMVEITLAELKHLASKQKRDVKLAIQTLMQMATA